MGEESIASALTGLSAADGPSSCSGGDDRSVYTSKARQQSTKDCEICQEVYQDDDLVRILPCGHYFHEHCILRYPSFPSAAGNAHFFLCPLLISSYPFSVTPPSSFL
jgi:hypothetical protein